jgi:hypothetical protein
MAARAGERDESQCSLACAHPASMTSHLQFAVTRLSYNMKKSLLNSA